MSYLAERLRKTAECDVLEIGRREPHLFDVNDAENWAKLMNEAADEIERFHSERSYILGFNDGWEGAQEQQPGDDRPFVPEDRIASLETEVAGLKLYAGEKSNQYVAAMEENKALRKALEPFAQAALAIRTAERMTRREFRDDETFQGGVAWRDGDKVRTITIGDFRRARVASEKRGEE